MDLAVGLGTCLFGGQVVMTMASILNQDGSSSELGPRLSILGQGSKYINNAYFGASTYRDNAYFGSSKYIIIAYFGAS